MSSVKVKVKANNPEAAASPSLPTAMTPVAAAPALASSGSTQTQVGFGKAAEGSAATGASSVAGKVDGLAKTPAFEAVVAQLCRVIAGCSKLLVLKGIIGEREERALSAMSNRGSPVLLAAVEAYGANQDLEVRHFLFFFFFGQLRCLVFAAVCCGICAEPLVVLRRETTYLLDAPS